MAKRQRVKTSNQDRIQSKSIRKTTPQRRFQTISKQSLLRRKRHKPFNINLNEIEDNRLPNQKKRYINATPALFTYALYKEYVHARNTPKRILQKPGFYFDVRGKLRWQIKRRIIKPNKAVICWRRKIRRAVLFANKKTAKGAGAKTRRYTHDSGISCNRR